MLLGRKRGNGRVGAGVSQDSYRAPWEYRQGFSLLFDPPSITLLLFLVLVAHWCKGVGIHIRDLLFYSGLIVLQLLRYCVRRFLRAR